MTDQYDTLAQAIPIEDIAYCYCKLYRNEPWNQEFDPIEIEAWLRKITFLPGIRMETILKNGIVVAFYIAKNGFLKDTLPLFCATVKTILSTPVSGFIVNPEDCLDKKITDICQIVSQKIPEGAHIHYLMDIGILPQYRNAGIARRMYAIMNRNIGDNGYLLAQTLSIGEMADILKRVEDVDIIQQIPIGNSGLSHIIFIFPAQNFPRRRVTT